MKEVIKQLLIDYDSLTIHSPYRTQKTTTAEGNVIETGISIFEFVSQDIDARIEQKTDMFKQKYKKIPNVTEMFDIEKRAIRDVGCICNNRSSTISYVANKILREKIKQLKIAIINNTRAFARALIKDKVLPEDYVIPKTVGECRALLYSEKVLNLKSSGLYSSITEKGLDDPIGQQKRVDISKRDYGK